MAVQTYYVDPTAGVNGSGTIGSPFNSWTNARTALTTAFNTSTDDYTIVLGPGTDTSSGTWIIGGTGGARILRVEASTPHTGVRGTGYRQTGSIFGFETNNTLVDVQLYGIVATNFIADGSQNNMTVDRCMSLDAGNGFYTGAGVTVYRNCAAYSATTNGFMCELNNGTPTVDWLNCVSFGAGAHGFRRNTGTARAKNCYSGGNGTEAYTGTITKTNCMHDTATTFTGSTASTAFTTANFTSVTDGSENAHLVSGSALIGAGVGPSSDAAIPTTDVDGDTRSGATTDVGFDQLVTSGDTPITVDSGSGVGEGQSVTLIFDEAYVLPVTNGSAAAEGQEIPFILAQPGSEGSAVGQGQSINLLTVLLITVDAGSGTGAGQDITLTLSADDVPDSFSFGFVFGTATSEEVISAPITVSGINGESDITVTDGEYSINGGAATSDAGVVVSGDLVRAHHTSSASYSTSTSTTVTIGGVSAIFTSLTGADPLAAGSHGHAAQPGGMGRMMGRS